MRRMFVFWFSGPYFLWAILPSIAFHGPAFDAEFRGGVLTKQVWQLNQKGFAKIVLIAPLPERDEE